MNDSTSRDRYWYTRRDGVVRGPFPAVQITRHMLLGRIRMTDELRVESEEWRLVLQCESLFPEELRAPLTRENQARLQQARMAADERTPGDRRAREPAPPQEILERRSGVERRRPEPIEVVRFRELRYRESGQAAPLPTSSTGRSLGGLWLAGLLGLLLLWWLVY